MTSSVSSTDMPLSGLTGALWRDRLRQFGARAGACERLGRRHWALTAERGDEVLLVSFELSGTARGTPESRPLGLELTWNNDWSVLTLLADGFTWFRDRRVYAFFDRLIDEGYFDRFERIVFYGSGMCGYAAAAFSVAAPGATVVALEPQATLDPDIAIWDQRFLGMRRVSFTDRYGYAPEMLEGAERAFILYNPENETDAMHATLFRRENATLIRCRHIDGRLEPALKEMGVLEAMIAEAGRGRLDAHRFAELYRARRDHLPYLTGLLSRLEDDDRMQLMAYLCRNAYARLGVPRFAEKLREIGVPLAAAPRR